MTFEWLPIPLPYVFEILDARELGLDAKELELSRDSSLKLLTSIHIDNLYKEEDNAVPGEENKGATISLLTKYLSKSFLYGCRITKWTSTQKDVHMTTQLTGLADSLSVTYRDASPVAISEWLANVPKLIWLRSTERVVTEKTIRKRGDHTVESEIPIRSFGRDYSEFEIGLPNLSTIQIGTVNPKLVTEGTYIESPGFIEFRGGSAGLPDEKLRHSVQRAFEFIFGSGLGVLGHSEIDEQGRIVRAEMRSAYITGGVGGVLPPALLHPQMSNSIEEKLVTVFLCRYIELEPLYDLNRAVWLYLHARNSPLDMSAGYIGAAFEILRRGYYSQPENVKRSRLMPGELWQVVIKKLNETIDAVAQTDRWKQESELFEDLKIKFNNLNQISSTKLNLRFLDDLGLNYGSIEQDALQSRNEAVHAKRLEESDIFGTLQAYRALHTLFARAFFAVLGIEVCYYDYSSLKFPVRRLCDRQGG